MNCYHKDKAGFQSLVLLFFYLLSHFFAAETGRGDFHACFFYLLQ